MLKKELPKEIKEILKELSKKECKMRFPDSIQTLDSITKVEEKTGNYTKKNCDMTLLKEEQKKLKELIICDENKDYFEVCNMECTTGKTYTMINSIPYYLDEIAYGRLPKKGILIVLRQISECNKYAEELNTLFQKKVALSITSDEYFAFGYEEAKKIKVKQLSVVQYYPVVFITHSKYQMLCLNDDERKVYTKNRRLLIIDESIDICEIVRLNNSFLDNIKKILDIEDNKKLQSLIQPIEERILKTNVEKNVVHNFKTDKKNLEVLNEIENKEYLNKYGNNQHNIKKFISIIRIIYSGTSLINVNYHKNMTTDEEVKIVEISAVDHRIKMWKLENNIILDASAPLNMKYELDTRLYHNLNLEPVLDHSKWKIKYVWANSTKSAKGIESDELEKNYIYKNVETKEIKAKQNYRRNFYKCCSEIIKELGENNTLAVGTKLEHIIERIDNEYKINPFSQCKVPVDNIVHYGDITGKREYGDIKNVLVFHTFNYRDTDYILQYLYYSNITDIKDGTTFEIRNPYMLDNTPIFVDQKLQEYKEKTMANHLYQAIKRVNREMIYDTTVVIVSIYLGAILYVRDMLTNCECKECKEYSLMFNHFSEKEDHQKEQSEDNKFSTFFRRLTSSDIAFKMVDLFEDILKNNIPKDLHINKISEHIVELELKDLRDYLKIDTKHCSNALANDTVKDFMNENLIIYRKRKFHFNLY